MKDTLYFLSYDLIKNKDYKTLYEELENYNSIRVLESVWCLKYAENSVENLYHHFKQFIDNDDKFLVIETKDACGTNLENNPNDL